MRPLEFDPVKTTEQFLNNYEKHDRAVEIVGERLRLAGFVVLPYGPDRRAERTWGDDRPDLLIWKNGYRLSFADVKGRSKDQWMVNERAYKAYVNYSRDFGLPMACIWVNLATGHSYYAMVPFATPVLDQMPHDRNRVVKTEEVLPLDELEKELWILPW